MISINSYTPIRNRAKFYNHIKIQSLMNVNIGWDILKIWHDPFHIISFYQVYFRSLFQNFFRWYENLLRIFILYSHTLVLKIFPVLFARGYWFFQFPTVAIMRFIFFVEIYSFVFGNINLKKCIGMKTSDMGYTVNE